MFRKHHPLIAFLFCTALLPLPALAVEAGHDHNHGGRGSTPSASVVTEERTSPGVAGDAFDQQLQRMRDQHEKMQSARTTTERQRAMYENMQLMQQGMTMLREMPQPTCPGMGRMHGGATGAGAQQPAGPNGAHMGMCMAMHGQMQQRQQLMETLMQMLMDQQAALMKK